MTKIQRRNACSVLVLIMSLIAAALLSSCQSKSGHLAEQREAMEVRLLSEAVFPILTDAGDLPDTPELRMKSERARKLATYVFTKNPKGADKQLLSNWDDGYQIVSVTIALDGFAYEVIACNMEDHAPANSYDGISISRKREGFADDLAFFVEDRGLSGNVHEGFVPKNLSADGETHRYDRENTSADEKAFFQKAYEEWVDLLMAFYESTPGEMD